MKLKVELYLGRVVEKEGVKAAAVEGKSGMTFIADENDRPLGENMPAELLSEGINFYIRGFGTEYRSCFFFCLENV